MSSALGRHLHRRDKGAWHELLRDLERPPVASPFENELSVAKLTFDDSELVANLSPELKIIRLENCLSLTTPALLQIPATCAALAAINLEETQSVDDAVVRGLAEHCPRLRVLKLGGCEKVSDDGIVALNDIPGATEKKVLARLDVSRCGLITGATFHELPESLEELDVSGCRLIDDNAIKNVAKVCVGLHTLHMRRCGKVTDVSLKVLLEASRFGVKCRALSLSGLDMLTERQTGQIGQRCPKLIELELAGAGGITDSVVGQIGRGCKDLERLDITACQNVGDSGVRSLSSSGKALRSLSLAGCHKFTNECTEDLATGFPRLHFLNLQGCTGIAPEFVQFVAKARPVVQVCGTMPVEKKLHWTSFMKEDKPADDGKKKKKKKKKKK